MKKTLISIATAVLCVCALSVPAYAENVLTDSSIYLENRAELGLAVKAWKYDGKTITPDVNTIMPVYTASIYDYAKTGEFKFEQDANRYYSDALDEDGNFAGSALLILENGEFRFSTYGPSVDKSRSIAFEFNAKRVNALMKKRGLSSDCKDVKLVNIEGAGFAYYIDNGTEKMLVAANIDSVNERIFNEKNGGIIVIGDELKAAADEELAEYNKFQEEYQKYVESLGLGPDDPLPGMGGYETPMFTVDNTPYLEEDKTPDDDPANPNTGSGYCAVASTVALISLAAGAFAAVKKRENK